MAGGAGTIGARSGTARQGAGDRERIARQGRIATRPRWSRGDRIVYREVVQGRVWTARPVTVIKDTPGLVALHLHQDAVWQKCTPSEAGVELVRCKAGRSPWHLSEAVWTFESTVILIDPAAAHATHVMWDAAQAFAGWYVNLQAPLRRTRLGFDFLDQELDIVVQPDGGWRWKDEAHLAQAEALGLFSAAQAQAIRAEGRRVIARIEARSEPFTATWQGWRPPAAWGVPELPAGWDELDAGDHGAGDSRE